jgi:hypothetical protein
MNNDGKCDGKWVKMVKLFPCKYLREKKLNESKIFKIKHLNHGTQIKKQDKVKDRPRF